MRYFKLLAAARRLVRNGPLVQDGWTRSYLQGESVDKDGHPIPWITYPALDFIAPRMSKLENVYEYGCGNGTLWWAARAVNVKAVEHDLNWYEKMNSIIPGNVSLSYEDINFGDSYEENILTSKCEYDVIIIDGRHRNNCMLQAPKRIKKYGVIILDNSDRPKYQKGVDYLVSTGLKKIEFSGFCPIVNFKSQTSIFYGPNNFLGI